MKIKFNDKIFDVPIKFGKEIESLRSKSKVKTLKPIDNEKLQKAQDIASKVLPAWRLEQGLKEIFGEEEPDRRRMGDFMRWVASDVIKEESDTIEESGLERKDVMKVISKIAKDWFFEQENF